MAVNNLLNLTGKIAIVTGSSKGLGKAFALALAEAGCKVIVNSRHGAELTAVDESIRQLGREVLPVEADITREGDVRRLVDQTVERFGQIDILVNNAATGRVNKPPEKTSLEDWQHVLNTNVTGMFLCAREVSKVMIPRRQGKIINLASMSGMIINRYFHGGSYDISKSAVAAMTKALAAEWAPYNIQVNALAPGYYNTEPNQQYFDHNLEIRRKVLDLIPLGRFGNVEELAGLLVCLASGVSNYMTGSVIVIDGGYTIW